MKYPKGKKYGIHLFQLPIHKKGLSEINNWDLGQFLNKLRAY